MELLQNVVSYILFIICGILYFIAGAIVTYIILTLFHLFTIKYNSIITPIHLCGFYTNGICTLQVVAYDTHSVTLYDMKINRYTTLDRMMFHKYWKFCIANANKNGEVVVLTPHN